MLCPEEPTPHAFHRIARHVSSASFYYAHLAYIVAMVLCGAVIIYGCERGVTNASFVDALFSATSAVCCVGHTIIDPSAASKGTLITLLVLMLTGANAVLSLVPTLLRVQRLRLAAHNAGLSASELSSIDEYAALSWVLRLGAVYPVACILVVFIAIGGSLSTIAGPADGNSAWWIAIFHAISSFCNTGFGLSSNNMVPWQGYPGMLIPMLLAMLLGNTCYPIVFRAMLASAHHCCPRRARPALAFALRHPQRVSTHLYSSPATRVLGYLMLLLFCGQVVVFLALEANSGSTQGLSPAVVWLVALFQAGSSRTGGFNAVNLASLSAAVQLVYVLCMYIPSYPIEPAIRIWGEGGVALARKDAEGVISSPAKPGDTPAGTPTASAGDGGRGGGGGSSTSSDAAFITSTSISATLRSEYATIPQTARDERGTSGGSPDATAVILTPEGSDASSPAVIDFRRGSSGGGVDTSSSSSSSSSSSASRPEADVAVIVAGDKSLHHRLSQHLQQEQQQQQQQQSPIRRQASSSITSSHLNNLVEPFPPPVGLHLRSYRGPLSAFLAHVGMAASREIPLLLLAVFVIAVSERTALSPPQPTDTPLTLRYGLWAIIFEIVSAFGTVGLSLGSQLDGLSLSTHFSDVSKLVMVIVMIAGRHRDLPARVNTHIPSICLRDRRADHHHHHQENDIDAAVNS